MPEAIDAISSELDDKRRDNQDIIASYLEEVNKTAVGAIPEFHESYSGTSVEQTGEPSSIEAIESIEYAGELSPLEQVVLTRAEFELVDEWVDRFKNDFTELELHVVIDADGDGLDDALDQKIETSAQTATKLTELREKCAKEKVRFDKIMKAIAKKLSFFGNSSVNDQVANLLGNVKPKGVGDISPASDNAEGFGVFKIGAMDD